MAKKFVEIKEAREHNGWRMAETVEHDGERWYYMQKGNCKILFWHEKVQHVG